MKSAAAIALLALTTAAPAFAQTAPTPPAAPTAPAATGKFTLDTPIETIVADPKGKAVIDADIPPLTSHPAYDQFKSMSLKALQPLSNGAITDDLLKKVAADLAAIK
jgi:hypothetical protein